MGELEKLSIASQLSIMKPPREDLMSMIHLNSQGVPEVVPYESLIDVCAHGLTYGAMRTICPTCKTILHTDGAKYRCFGKSFLWSKCNYFRYHVKTAAAPWEIPESVKQKELETLKRKSRNYEAVSFLDTVQKNQRNDVIRMISEHKYCPLLNDAKLYSVKGGIPYSYFLVMNDDFIGNYPRYIYGPTGKSSYCFGQIHVIQGNPLSYCFYKKEKVYENPCDYCYWYTSVDEAIKQFEEQFHTISGNTWKSWIEGNFVRNEGSFFPLEMDYYSRLPYLKAQEIDEIHEEIGVKLEYLKKLKIDGKEITELSIQEAQKITVQIVMDAYDILECFKGLEVQGTQQKMVAAVKNQLKFLDDEEGLKFGSIVSRMLTPLAGTTIRLVDLPLKFMFFQPIGKILSVFFNYQKLKQEWPDPHQIWPSSAKKLTQGYMLDMTRGVIGSWIMKLVFSPNEQMHHYYVKKKDSGCCYWSVLLRKARKAFDDSSPDCFILCTMDVEELPECPEGLKHDMKEDMMFMDKQSNMKEIFLTKIDETYYNKCGYILHSKNRAKMVMVFPIKYNDRPDKLDNNDMLTWINFISLFYSPVTKPDKSLIAKAKSIFDKKGTPLIYLGKADKKSTQKFVCDYFDRGGLEFSYKRQKRS